MDSIKKNSSRVCLVLSALTLIAATTAAAPRTAAPAKTSITARPTNTVQLADEITRRLRRIGISFTRTRLPHPYDPAGEIC